MTSPVYSPDQGPEDLTWQLRQEVRSPSLDNEAIVRSWRVHSLRSVAASTTAKWLAGQYAV